MNKNMKGRKGTNPSTDEEVKLPRWKGLHLFNILLLACALISQGITPATPVAVPSIAARSLHVPATNKASIHVGGFGRNTPLELSQTPSPCYKNMAQGHFTEHTQRGGDYFFGST